MANSSHATSASAASTALLGAVAAADDDDNDDDDDDDDDDDADDDNEDANGDDDDNGPLGVGGSVVKPGRLSNRPLQQWYACTHRPRARPGRPSNTASFASVRYPCAVVTAI